MLIRKRYVILFFIVFVCVCVSEKKRSDLKSNRSVILSFIFIVIFLLKDAEPVDAEMKNTVNALTNKPVVGKQRTLNPFKSRRSNINTVNTGVELFQSKLPRHESGFRVHIPPKLNPHGLFANPAGDEKGSPDDSGSGILDFTPKKFDKGIKLAENDQFNLMLKNSKKKSKKRSKNCNSVSKERVLKAHDEFIKKIKDKNLLYKVSKERFCDLYINLQTVYFDEKSIFEVQGGLQLEAQGLISNLRRIKSSNAELDFKCELVKTQKTIFLDHKGMIDFNQLAIGKNADVSNFPTHESVAFNMGKSSIAQKERFLSFENGPNSTLEVFHVYNFDKMLNSIEKPYLVKAVMDEIDMMGGDQYKGFFINFN